MSILLGIVAMFFIVGLILMFARFILPVTLVIIALIFFPLEFIGGFLGKVLCMGILALVGYGIVHLFGLDKE